MKKQKHTRMPFFAFHFTSGDYSGEIYTPVRQESSALRQQLLFIFVKCRNM